MFGLLSVVLFGISCRPRATRALWQLLVLTRLYPCFVSHLCPHFNLPNLLTDSNAWADNLVSGLALGLPTQTPASVEAARLSHAVYHQNASALHRQFISMPLHMLVRPLSMSLLTAGYVGSRACLCFS
jgi:hypothetical protein